jgi:hypothetical protein
LRQAIQIGREAFLLGAWRNRMGAHNQQLNIKEWQTGWYFSSRYPIYNTVVLGCNYCLAAARALAIVGDVSAFHSSTVSERINADFFVRARCPCSKNSQSGRHFSRIPKIPESIVLVPAPPTFPPAIRLKWLP